MNPTTKTNRNMMIVWNSFFAILLVALLIGNIIASSFGVVLGPLFGYVESGGESEAASSGEVDTQYYKPLYSKEEALTKAAELTEQMVGEGCVLLKNENGALPLATGSKISIFGINSVNWSTTGVGSVSSDYGTTWDLKRSFEEAGFQVNPELWEFYKNDKVHVLSGSDDLRIIEVPQADYTAQVKASYAGYKDAAVVVITRRMGENQDSPMHMDNFGGSYGEHSLELNQTEREMFQAIKEAGFEKVIVILNIGLPFECGFLEELQVDACLTASSTGADGLAAIGKILSGAINPSAHLTDTYAYDLLSAPATQNFGNFVYLNANGEDSLSRYVNYAEGIYVGYRYYETRYEDVVLGRTNADAYDYPQVVKYPFGYGLSYTEFSWSDFSVDAGDDSITATVTVKNVGNAAGKDVVQIYVQAPYIEGGVEKASVVLADFAKTGLLQPGEQETVSVTFDKNRLDSYSMEDACYVRDAGDYYVTAAENAHLAINNILAAKGYTAEDGMDADGNGKMVYRFTLNQTEKITQLVEDGATVQNLFADAQDDGTEYLSRMHWEKMDNNGLWDSEGKGKTTDVDGYKTASAELLDAIKAKGWDNSGIPAGSKNTADISFKQESGLSLVSMRDKSWDDPDWGTLLSTMSWTETKNLFLKGGYQNEVVESINKPRIADNDGPSSIHSALSGVNCYQYPSGIILACTWNKELANEFGELIGHDSLYYGTTGWYAPAFNLHRAPFGGRNAEYYSEDPILSGDIASKVVAGAQKYGMYAYVKHFAVNNQEMNRHDICTYATEQSIRELYLKAFQICFVEGDDTARENALGVMTSMNRIGVIQARGNYNLITGYLRGELNWKGIVVTDMCTDSGQQLLQNLAAGNNLQLSTSIGTLPDAEENYVRNAARDSAKYVMYVTANSNAMNGYTPTVQVTGDTPLWIVYLVLLDVFVVACIAVGDFLIIKKYKNSKRESKS